LAQALRLPAFCSTPMGSARCPRATDCLQACQLPCRSWSLCGGSLNKVASADSAGPYKRPPLCKTAVGRLLDLCRAQAALFVAAVACLFASTAGQLIIACALGEFCAAITDSSGVQMDRVNSAMAKVMVASVSMSALSGLRSTLFQLAGEQTVRQLRHRIFATVLRQEMSFFDSQPPGTLISRLASDSQIIQVAVSDGLSVAFRALFTVILFLIAMFATSWRLSLVVLVMMPPFSFLVGATGVLSRRISRRYHEKVAESGKVASDTVHNMHTVRSFKCGEDVVSDRFNRALEEASKHGQQSACVAGGWSGFVALALSIAISSMLWTGAAFVADGELQASQLISFILFTVNLAYPLIMVSSLVPRIGMLTGALQRVYDLVERAPAMLEGEDDPGECHGVVEFRNVTFAYATRQDVNVLESVSFTAQPNQLTAFVGASGSGKSSCIALLQRLHDPIKGEVLIDGRDMRTLRNSFLRQHLGVVAQDPVLFDVSVGENISFGSPGASHEQIATAAKMANCHDFIVQFPDSYATNVGGGGVQLSGGQRQRIAIARALLADPTVLLLDEATSGLDAESEGIVLFSLNSLVKGKRGRTVIVAGHRLSAVCNADLIIVLQDGVLVEFGSHRSLLQLGRVYTDLMGPQLQQVSKSHESQQPGCYQS